ncbi:MAG: membrane-bound serine protease (ClpP class) [Paraglaciecola sp.]|jgi:membrane-bound serine protease (ClpP class)
MLKIRIVLLLLLLILLFLPPTVAAGNKAWVLDIRGPIGVATTEYVVSGIDSAHAMITMDKPELIILRMDTPGGLDNAMRQIIQRILSSTIPVVGYVYPQGGRAASAGTYILYATHIAAMAPATTLGAATPVQIGASQAPRTSDNDNHPQQTQPASTMERKITNDAIAYIEGLADLRGRNRQWAAEAVRSAASLSASDALKNQVINIIALDTADLLHQLQGRRVILPDKEVILDTSDTELVTVNATWRQEFLSVISNPSIAYVLMIIGVYGLIFEFSNPGVGVLGIVGAACILLALYAFQVLPVNYVGVCLIILGVGLMITEAFVPSFGIFGIVGTVVLIIGSVILIDSPEPALQIAWPLIFSVALVSAGFTFLTFTMLFKNRRRPVVSGVGTLIGRTAQVELIHKTQALIRLQGELWQVQADSPLKPGDCVKVISRDGLILNVSKQPEVQQNG